MKPEDVLFHACALLTLLMLAGLYALRSPDSWLSRWLDRRVDAAIAAEFAPDGAR